MNKRFLITGSSRGLGRSIALKLADDGFDIIVHCLSNIEMAKEVCAKAQLMGVKANLLAFDVSDRKATRASLIADIDANGPYYGIVCNAGIHRDKAFPSLTNDDWDEVIDTNLKSIYKLSKSVIKSMIKRKLKSYF